MERPELVFLRDKTILRFFLAYLILTCLVPWGVVPASNAPVPEQSSGCTDSIKSCKRPVKFISQDNGCYTFACEYGKSTQNNIHTKNQADVKVLLQMAKGTGN